MSEPSAVTYYWRPGCPFCSMLERKLVKRRIPLDKRNIWEEPTHATAVREIAGGNETVPTVVVGDEALVNPSIAAVVAAIEREAPTLAAGLEADGGGDEGFFRRLLGSG